MSRRQQPRPLSLSLSLSSSRRFRGLVPYGTFLFILYLFLLNILGLQDSLTLQLGLQFELQNVRYRYSLNVQDVPSRVTLAQGQIITSLQPRDFPSWPWTTTAHTQAPLPLPPCVPSEHSLTKIILDMSHQNLQPATETTQVRLHDRRIGSSSHSSQCCSSTKATSTSTAGGSIARNPWW